MPRKRCLLDSSEKIEIKNKMDRNLLWILVTIHLFNQITCEPCYELDKLRDLLYLYE